MTIDVRTIRRRFFEHTVHDGDVEYHQTDVIDETMDNVAEVIGHIRGAGLTYQSTGNVWAGDPDGSQVIDYATGEREEVSVHLYNLYEWEWAAITAGVDADGFHRVNPGVPGDWTGN